MKWACAALAIAALSAAEDARACAVCGCGDPTLTVLGSEPPGDMRVRAAIELRHRTDRVGEPGVDELRLSEQRLDTSIAVSPIRRLFIIGTVPALRREVTYSNLAVRGGYAIGDAELRVKAFIAQDRTFAPHHLFALVAGAKLPTGRRQEGLPPELQAGTGATDAIVGASYTFIQYPWSVYASAQLSVPLAGVGGDRASRSVRSTVVTQVHVSSAVAMRGGVDARFDGRAKEAGETDANSGGAILFGVAEGVFGVSESLMLLASLRVPLWNGLYGFHREGPILAVAAAYDF
jgi:hypothetical protein